MTTRGGRPRDERLNATILSAAIELLRQKGYANLRIDDVSNATGCAKTTIYRRWPTLQHLVVAAMEQAVGDVSEPTGEDVGKSLVDLIHARSRTLEDESLIGISLDLIAHEDGDLSERYRQLIVDPFRCQVIQLLGTLGESAGASSDRLEVAADALLGGLIFRSVVLGRSTSQNDVVCFVDNILKTFGHQRSSDIQRGTAN